jgi:hypothetical protein
MYLEKTIFKQIKVVLEETRDMSITNPGHWNWENQRVQAPGAHHGAHEGEVESV